MTARARKRGREGDRKRRKRGGGIGFSPHERSTTNYLYLSLGGRAGLVLGTVLISSSRR